MVEKQGGQTQMVILNYLRAMRLRRIWAEETVNRSNIKRSRGFGTN